MGFVGFTYLIIFLVILYYVILLAILAGGFALFYYGLRSHRKPENEKKAWPIIPVSYTHLTLPTMITV